MQESHVAIYLGALLSVGIGIAGWVLVKVIAIEVKLASFSQWLEDHEGMDQHNFTSIGKRLDGIDSEIKDIKNQMRIVEGSVQSRQNQILDAIHLIDRKMLRRPKAEQGRDD